MTAVFLFSILVILTVGIWMVVVISLWYGRELLKRQRALTYLLLPYLKKIEQEKATLKSLHIDKNELISKYKEVTLPDEVQVAFSDSEK